MVKETDEQKKVIDNLNKFFNSREEVINFLETIFKCYLILITMKNKMKVREQDLKAGNNLESLLNAIRQIVYSLYQPKQIAKKV